MNESLIEGIITGVLSTALIGGSLVFLRQIIIPVAQKYLFNWPDYSGRWVASMATVTNERFSLELNLKHRGSMVRGSMNIQKRSNGQEVSIASLKCYGRSFDGYLGLISKTTNKNRGSFNCLLLKGDPLCEKLTGNYSFRALDTDRILSRTIVFVQRE